MGFLTSGGLRITRSIHQRDVDVQVLISDGGEMN